MEIENEPQKLHPEHGNARESTIENYRNSTHGQQKIGVPAEYGKQEAHQFEDRKFDSEAGVYSVQNTVF